MGKKELGKNMVMHVVSIVSIVFASDMCLKGGPEATGEEHQ